MRHIYQRYQTDCFPTCIAMVSGLSHQEAIRRVHPFRQKGRSYETYDSQGVRVLRSLGFKVRKRYIKNFTSLKQPAILTIEYKELQHVVVWDPEQKKVLDPSRFPFPNIADYKRYLLHVYILS